MARGLDRAAALGPRRRGHIDIGATFTPTSARAEAEALLHLMPEWGNLSGYASAWVGMSRVGGSWEKDFGGTAGLRIEF